MSLPYQHAQKITLNQQAMSPTERDLAGCDAVLLVLPASGARISWQVILNDKPPQRAWAA